MNQKIRVVLQQSYFVYAHGKDASLCNFIGNRTLI